MPGDDVQRQERDQRDEEGLGDHFGGEAALEDHGVVGAAHRRPQRRHGDLKVVVLTPPPVLPGEAPMNISAIITKSAGVVIAPMSMVLKPAVRAVTDWNQAASTRSPAVSRAERARVVPLERQKRERADRPAAPRWPPAPACVCTESRTCRRRRPSELGPDEEARGRRR